MMQCVPMIRCEETNGKTNIYLVGELIRTVPYRIDTEKKLSDALVGHDLEIRGFPFRIVKINNMSIIVDTAFRRARSKSRTVRNLLKNMLQDGVWVNGTFVRVLEYHDNTLLFSIGDVKYSTTYSNFHSSLISGGIDLLIKTSNITSKDAIKSNKRDIVYTSGVSFSNVSDIIGSIEDRYNNHARLNLGFRGKVKYQSY